MITKQCAVCLCKHGHTLRTVQNLGEKSSQKIPTGENKPNFEHHIKARLKY